MKVKILTSSRAHGLEEAINEYIASVNIKVIDIKYCSSNSGFQALIMYEEI